MPRGFGRGAGWWFGYGGYPFWGWGGRGNPFPFCRWFPWLPRWWWLYSPYGAMPYAGSYAATIPNYPGYGYPYYSPGYMPPYGYPGYGVGYPGTAAPTGAPTK